MSAELQEAFDSISKIVEAAKADRERFGNIAATIRVNALRNGATTDEAEAMVRGDIDFLKWVCAKVEANTAQPEHEPQSCTENDGCPTEPQGYVEITEEMIVAGRKAADDQYYKWCGFGPREDGQGLDGMHFIVREALKAALSTQATKYAVPADWPKKMLPLDEHVTPGAGPLAARPAPQPAAEHEYPDPLIAEDRYEDDQPAADTRVVTVAQLERWMGYTSEHGGAAKCLKEIRTIIGTATPAPSNKIVEAARAAHDALWELNPDNYTHDDVLKLNDASVEAIFLLADVLGEIHGKTPEWWDARRRTLAGQGETP